MVDATLFRNWPIQSLVSDAVLHPRGMVPVNERDVWHGMVHDMYVRNIRHLVGPRAPQRKRPKRVAKKIAQRGGMLRCKGLVQAFHRAWPALAWLREGAQ